MNSNQNGDIIVGVDTIVSTQSVLRTLVDQFETDSTLSLILKLDQKEVCKFRFYKSCQNKSLRPSSARIVSHF